MRVRRLGDNGLVLRILVVELKVVAISVLSPVAARHSNARDSMSVWDSHCRNSSRTAGVRPSWANTCGCSSVTVGRNPVGVSSSTA